MGSDCIKKPRTMGKKNILILPDTRFDEKAIPRMLDMLHEYDLVAAVHQVPALDADKWGIISRTHIYEKPFVINKEVKYYMKAWGLLGFSKEVGVGLFNNQIKQQNYKLPCEPSFVHLDSFKDITRSGTLEKY